jgi:lysozyme family protein
MLDDILRREGGFVDDPDDRGGATNHGITKVTLSYYHQRFITVDEVKDLTPDLARKIYKERYYDSPKIEELPEEIRPFIFDASVNHGPGRAIRFVQSVCNGTSFSCLLEDGVVGKKTIAAANQAQEQLKDCFLICLIEKRRCFYNQIVDKNPSQSKFLAGWMNRISEFKQEVA